MLLLSALVLAGLGTLFAANKVDSADHQAMVVVLARLRDLAVFADQPSDQPGEPGRPRLYGDPQNRRVTVSIYGLTSTAQQDQVLTRLRQWPSLPRAVIVRFFEREVWLPMPQGGRQHGPEALLREEQLAAP